LQLASRVTVSAPRFLRERIHLLPSLLIDDGWASLTLCRTIRLVSPLSGRGLPLIPELKLLPLLVIRHRRHA